MVHTQGRKCLRIGGLQILWDFPIQTDKTIEHNRPDIIDKKNKKCLLIDPACPFDTRTDSKEEEKWTNYSKLKYEIERIWKLVPDRSYTGSNRIIRNINKILWEMDRKSRLNLTIEALQKTTRIMRKVLNLKWEKKMKLHYQRQLIGVRYYSISPRK